VTRLGEFSPNGRMLTLNRFYKITEEAQDVWATSFLNYRLSINFDQKMVWTTFWAIFLVTLTHIQYHQLMLIESALGKSQLVNFMYEMASICACMRMYMHTCMH
jgi:hypothetical protein